MSKTNTKKRILAPKMNSKKDEAQVKESQDREQSENSQRREDQPFKAA